MGEEVLDSFIQLTSTETDSTPYLKVYLTDIAAPSTQNLL